MLKRNYKCPKCRKTVAFEDGRAVTRKSCPECGQGIMDWDGKPDRQQHGSGKTLVPPKVAALVVVALIIATVLYFWCRR